MSKVVALVASVLLLSCVSTTCPDRCVCKWKGGKQTVECINQGLQSLPSGIDSETQVLDVSGSVLQLLHGRVFHNNSLLNLQRIYLSRCRLGHLDDHCFYGLTNLVELDLSDNMLIAVPSSPLRHVPSLMRLSLARNPIQRIASQAFAHLQYLTWLELSNCEIQTVDNGAFQGLANLEWLRLDNNRLKEMSGTSVLPASLHGIALQGNPWHCDCRLAELHSWLLYSNVPTSIDPVCQWPEKFANRPVKGLESADFSCPPELSALSTVLEVAKGRNASLVCQVISGDPQPRITWWRHGQRLLDSRLVSYEDRRSLMTIVNVTENQAGTYVCIAENPAGRSSCNFTLVVLKQATKRDSNISTAEYATIVGGSVAAIVFTLMIVVVAIAVRCRCCRSQQTHVRKVAVNRVEVQETETKPTSPVPLTALPATDSSDTSPDLLNSTNKLKWQEISVDSAVFDVSRDSADKYRTPSDSVPTISEYIPHLVACQQPSLTRLQSSTTSTQFLDQEGFPPDYGLPKPLRVLPLQEQALPYYENYFLDSRGNFLPSSKYPDDYAGYSTGSDIRLPYERYPEQYVYHRNPEEIYARAVEPQVPSRTHESPDEGYEDGAGPDGTEI